MQGKSEIPPELRRMLGITPPPLTEGDQLRLRSMLDEAHRQEQGQAAVASARARMPEAFSLRPEHLGAYAPDPDADYREGVAAGRRMAAEEPSPIHWQPPRPPTRAYQAIRAAIFLLGLALGALLFWGGR